MVHLVLEECTGRRTSMEVGSDLTLTVTPTKNKERREHTCMEYLVVFEITLQYNEYLN